MAVNRDTVGVVVIAFLAVVGLGITAATVDSTYSSDLPGAGDGTGPGDGEFGQDDDFGGGQNGEQVDPDDRGTQSPLQLPEICIDVLTQAPVILGIIIGILTVVGLAYYRFGFIGASFVAYLVGLPATIGYGLVTQCGTTGGSGDGGSPIADFIANSPFGGSLATTPVPPAVLIGIFAVAAVGAVVALISATGSEDIEAPVEEEEDEPDLGEFAAAAGAAADRIESTDADVDNEVYRAWQEMTGLLDLPNPESSTAGQFAAAAVEAGMDEDDVDQLTRLFEEVRYGDMDPEPREDLAVETLRNIEERYGTPDDVADGEVPPGDEIDEERTPDGSDTGNGDGGGDASGGERS